MVPRVYFVVVVDADPKKSFWGANDDDLLKKYHTAQDLIGRCTHGKAIICVHTSPQYRDRFFKPPFLAFWKSWVKKGGELIFHPENDQPLVAQSSFKAEPDYHDKEYMEALIREKMAAMREPGLAFTAFRGGLFGFTDGIADILRKVGIRIDLSCAPEQVLPERAADWSGAPVSSYYMSRKSYHQPDPHPGKDSVFEIPLGWDGKGKERGRNYLFHERSTFKKMCLVWDAIVERSAQSGQPQFVNFLCHTYSMANSKFRTQLERILNYMRSHDGVPVTASKAKGIYDELLS